MEANNMIYHGSNVEVPNPKILVNGFYCTNYEKQAKRWALTKNGASVVNRYSYEINTDLKVLRFEKMTEEFLSGRFSRAAFWELVKFNYPTHQIVFCNEKALECIHFEGVIQYDE
jgi:hypothetical protein